jgi:hypothetical protein
MSFVSVRQTAFIAIVSFIIMACGQKTITPIQCPSSMPRITYAQLANEVLSGCTPCHRQDMANRNGSPKDVNYDDYASARTHAVSGLETMLSGLMPPGAAMNANLLSHQNICLMQAWIWHNYPRE